MIYNLGLLLVGLNGTFPSVVRGHSKGIYSP
jgi:hypothetical protein